MKKASIALLFLIIVSCNENESPVTKSSKAQFSFSQKTVLASGKVADEAISILITVKNSEGTTVYDKKKLSLYKFDSEYISEPLSFILGDYYLTEYFVLDSSNEIIYATPLEGSPLAYLVDDPLPIQFSIFKDETIKVSPEVITVKGSPASDFGYTTFTLNLIETFKINVATFAYSDSTNNFELTNADISITSIDSSFNNSKSLVYNGQLGEKTNAIIVEDGYGYYVLKISKPGYVTYIKSFLRDSIKSYTSDKVLTIVFSKSEELNRAMSLDGLDDYIDLGNIYDNVQLPITISSWILVDPSAKGQLPIFASQGCEYLYKGFWFVINPTHVFAGYGDGLGSNSSLYRRDKSAPHNNLFGDWVHVTAVINSAVDIDIYFNGVSQPGVYTGLSDSPMSSYYPNAVAKIGYLSSNGSSYHYKGLIDELRIWKRALSEEEIADQMTKTLLGNEYGLIGAWDFNEADGDTVFDKSINNFDGSIKGNATRVISGIPASK